MEVSSGAEDCVTTIVGHEAFVQQAGELRRKQSKFGRAWRRSIEIGSVCLVGCCLFMMTPFRVGDLDALCGILCMSGCM